MCAVPRAIREQVRQALAALAARQHGVVSVPQLTRLGIDKDAISRMVRAGHLHPIHRGVYAVGHPGLTMHATFIAAVLALGEGAVLSHESAAALWGWWRWDEREEAHVIVPRRARNRQG